MSSSLSINVESIFNRLHKPDAEMILAVGLGFLAGAGVALIFTDN